MGGGEGLDPDGLEPVRAQHLRQLTRDVTLGSTRDRPGGEADLGRQCISQTRLELQLGEQLVRGSRGDGSVHVRVLEDRADGAYERVGIEHGPMCPHYGGGQHDQDAGQGDEDADDCSPEPPLPGGAKPFEFLGQRIPFRLEAFDLRRCRGIFGGLGLRAAMGVAHLVSTLRQVAPMRWLGVPFRNETSGSVRSRPPIPVRVEAGVRRTVGVEDVIRVSCSRLSRNNPCRQDWVLATPLSAPRGRPEPWHPHASKWRFCITREPQLLAGVCGMSVIRGRRQAAPATLWRRRWVLSRDRATRSKYWCPSRPSPRWKMAEPQRERPVQRANWGFGDLHHIWPPTRRRRIGLTVAGRSTFCRVTGDGRDRVFVQYGQHGPGASYATGGGVPSALASSAGSQSHTAHAWRNAEWANSSPTARGSGLLQTSSQSRMYSPSAASQWAGAGVSVAVANASGAG